MSGIVGIFHLDGSPASVKLLAQMSDGLIHRGPDAVNHWHDGSVALGHRMLFATPESLREVQPFLDEPSGLAITFDGRLDNRDELAQQLLSNGLPAYSDTDVELVLNAYKCWRELCLEKLLGDFAFAIWDGKERRLFCARDSMGVKPFYYHFDGKKFLFCSEIRPLFVDTTIQAQPNTRLISSYMKEDFSEKTATLYRGINRIPPAHYLVIQEKGGISSNQYWNFTSDVPIRYKSNQEYVDHFLHLFRESVRCRLRAVGPVGTLLSGGLDSSSIVCTAQKLMAEGLTSDNRFETFSAVSNALPVSDGGESFDERDYIESVRHMYKLQSNYYFYEDQTPPVSIMETARYYRDVFYNPTFSVFTPLLEGANQNGIRVLLSGIGGDDILGSDPELYLYRYADLIRQLNITELMEDLGLALKYYAPLEVSGLFFKHGINPLVASLTKNLLSLLSLTSRHDNTNTRPRFFSIFQERIYQNLLQGWNTNGGLEDLDRCCSRHTIEPRHPFLDIRLVNFVLAVPPEQLSRRYQTKLILRRTMSGILPEMIRRRGTKGSASPLVERELKGAHQREIRQLLESPTLLEGIDWPSIRSIFAEYCENKRTVKGDIQKVVRAIGLELWHRTVIQSKENDYGRRSTNC